VRGSDTVSRQGGDELVVLVSEVERSDEPVIIATTMLEALPEAHFIDPHELHVITYLTGGTDPSPDADRQIKCQLLQFWEKIKKHDGLNHFNRHGIVHGIYDEYGVDLNFFRLITLLDLVLFNWHD
jgi:GGDEF domain-containing protein